MQSTATAAATTPRAARSANDLAADVEELWRETTIWIAHHWAQVAVALLIGSILVAVMIGLRRLGMRICREGTTTLADWRTIIGRVIARTRLWFMVAAAARVVTGSAYPPEVVSDGVRVAFTIAAALQSALWARELFIGVIEHRVGGDHADQTTLGSAIGIIRLLVTVGLFSIAGVLILSNLGVNVTGLIAGLGVGGIAIGLAAKGIFDDLFSALSIIFDKPFRRGDSIRWDQTNGTVEAIGLKSTRVRSVTGEEVVISNTNLLNKELHNLARLDRRRIVLAIGVTYQTPAETCAELPGIIRGIVEAQDKCSVVRCGMIGFGASSLDFELQFDVHSDVYDEVFEARHKVCVALLADFNTRGIDIAFPTQVNLTSAPDGRLIMPYPEDAAAPPPAQPLLAGTSQI